MLGTGPWPANDSHGPFDFVARAPQIAVADAIHLLQRFRGGLGKSDQRHNLVFTEDEIASQQVGVVSARAKGTFEEIRAERHGAV